MALFGEPRLVHGSPRLHLRGAAFLTIGGVLKITRPQARVRTRVRRNCHPLRCNGDYERARQMISDALFSLTGYDHQTSGKAAQQ